MRRPRKEKLSVEGESSNCQCAARQCILGLDNKQPKGRQHDASQILHGVVQNAQPRAGDHGVSAEADTKGAHSMVYIILIVSAVSTPTRIPTPPCMAQDALEELWSVVPNRIQLTDIDVATSWPAAIRR